MTTIRECRAAEIFDDPRSAELFEEYECECANRLLGSTAPQRALYEALENAGAGQCFGAYRDDVLCGVAFVLLGSVPHYAGYMAVVESVFVMRSERNGTAGGKLIKAVERWARDRGFAAIAYTAPAGGQLARMLFLRADEYTNTNHVFSKRLQ